MKISAHWKEDLGKYTLSLTTPTRRLAWYVPYIKIPYRIVLLNREIIAENVQKQPNSEDIDPSASEWTSQVVLVPNIDVTLVHAYNFDS